uniref:Thiol:disulfi de interchange protein n=1 Tax=Nemalion vermiculare TaxID=935621 RepID=UPI002579FB02|nr:Thiol:disulfi de interchange protein [Nemalion vermiculare]WGV34367.1 Thiol:disulfi de interchange protein [Nemalion vermiculare]
MLSNQLPTILYTVQQYITTVLISQTNNITLLSILTAFISGLVTSASPCVVYSIPFMAIYVNRHRKKRINLIFLISGICTSLLLIAVSSVILKKNYWNLFSKVPLLWPITIIILGFSLLNLIKLNFLRNKKDVQLPKYLIKNSFVATYWVGFSLGITISPCSTPITIALIAWINTTQNYFVGLVLLLIYLLGYVTPLIMTSLSLTNVDQLMKLSNRSIKVVPIIGCITITIGSFSLFKEIFKIA